MLSLTNCEGLGNWLPVWGLWFSCLQTGDDHSTNLTGLNTGEVSEPGKCYVRRSSY